MVSRIEQLINEIEEFIDSCKYQPLSNTKILSLIHISVRRLKEKRDDRKTLYPMVAVPEVGKIKKALPYAVSYTHLDHDDHVGGQRSSSS